MPRIADKVRVTKSYTGKGGTEGTVVQSRAKLDPADNRLEARFARKLRALMAERKLNSPDVSRLLAAGGVEIGPRGIDRWLRAEGGPRFGELEAIGNALGLEDYRELLPEPALKK